MDNYKEAVTPMSVGIVGSRDFDNYQLLADKMQEIKRMLYAKNCSITKVVSGGAKGADTLAEQWADRMKIEKLIYLPDWDTYKKSAGVMRNIQIVKACDLVVCFHVDNSKGTQHTIDICKARNTPVIIVRL